MPAREYDVIIVGMGPAGASAAYELSRSGVSVLAFDKQIHPRYKVCGGGLSARIAQILPPQFLGMVEETVYRVQFAYGAQQSFLIESSDPIAYMVMRQNFDRWLADRARQVGTEIHEGEKVVSIHNGEDAVDVVTTQARYRSRVVINVYAYYPSQAKQSSLIACCAISPRRTLSVLV